MKLLRAYRYNSLVILALFSALLVGCESSHEIAGQSSHVRVSSAKEVKALAVLDKHCAACHDKGSNDGGLGNILDPVGLVALGYIVPEQPDQSSVYTESLNQNMPVTYALNSQELQTLQEWIRDFNRVDQPKEGDPTRDFGKLYADILEPNCLSCHDVGQSTDLSSYENVQNYVVSELPNFSLLYTTLETSDSTDHEVSTEELTFIKDWIDRAAPF